MIRQRRTGGEKSKGSRTPRASDQALSVSLVSSEFSDSPVVNDEASGRRAPPAPSVQPTSTRGPAMHPSRMRMTGMSEIQISRAGGSESGSVRGDSGWGGSSAKEGRSGWEAPAQREQGERWGGVQAPKVSACQLDEGSHFGCSCLTTAREIWMGRGRSGRPETQGELSRPYMGLSTDLRAGAGRVRRVVAKRPSTTCSRDVG